MPNELPIPDDLQHLIEKRESDGRRKTNRRPLPPEAYARIRDEGYGRFYVQKQIRRKTPMVFGLYGETIDGIIVRRLTYSLDVLVNRDIRRIEKITTPLRN